MIPAERDHHGAQRNNKAGKPTIGSISPMCLPRLPLVALRKTSLVDYPGKVSTVVFFPGCNLRCPWCQNGELALGRGENLMSPEEALSHVAGRKAIVGAVVLSGGEPSIYPSLGLWIAAFHKLGLPVKLDTNGMNPQALETLFEKGDSRPDYIALDLKLAPERYGELLPAANARESGPAFPDESGGACPAAALIKSGALIRSSGIPHEYRSLALPDNRFGPGDIEALSPLVDDSPWHFRPFRPGNCLDPAWDRFEPPPRSLVRLLAETARGLGKQGIAHEAS
jgi:pyruvate formate lyase activating enzyme